MGIISRIKQKLSERRSLNERGYPELCGALAQADAGDGAALAALAKQCGVETVDDTLLATLLKSIGDELGIGLNELQADVDAVAAARRHEAQIPADALIEQADKELVAAADAFTRTRDESEKAVRDAKARITQATQAKVTLLDRKQDAERAIRGLHRAHFRAFGLSAPIA